MSEKLLVPQLNPNDTEVELTHWHKKTGDAVEKGEVICELTTTKAVYEHASPGNGFVAVLEAEGRRLRPGATMALLCETEKEAKAAAGRKVTEGSEAKQPVFSQKALAKLKELGKNESDFAGLEYVTEKMVEGRKGLQASSLRKEREISTLMIAHSMALRSSLTIQVDAEPVLRKLEKTGAKREAFLAWCVAQTLKEHPAFFQMYGMHDLRIDHLITYALDLGTGTRLLEARGWEKWAPEKWAEQIADWSLRLMRNEIKAEELHKGPEGFTITDLSSQGILFFEPLLVAGQSAILGIGGDLEARNPLLTFTLAFDHRVHDGRTGAAFLKTLKAMVLADGAAAQ